MDSEGRAITLHPELKAATHVLFRDSIGQCVCIPFPDLNIRLISLAFQNERSQLV